MWNSTVDNEIIEKIKEIVVKYNYWFNIREILNFEKRTDRMENEELIIVLSYINYSFKTDSIEKTLGFFQRIDRVTCRLKNKAGLTDFFSKLDDNINFKEQFLISIEEVEKQIVFIKNKFSNDVNSSTLNNFFNVKGSSRFKKSFQDFYILWLVLNSPKLAKEKDQDILEICKNFMNKLKNVNGEEMNNDYFNSFIMEINNFVETKF